MREGPTRDGSYAFTVVVRDKAGNRTEAPSSPHPHRWRPPGPRPGVDVRRLTLQGPSAPVSAGSLARLRVGPVSRRFRFALSRLGSTAALRQDIRRGGRLRVRIPDEARTGRLPGAGARRRPPRGLAAWWSTAARRAGSGPCAAPARW